MPLLPKDKGGMWKKQKAKFSRKENKMKEILSRNLLMLIGQHGETQEQLAVAAGCST